MLKVNSIQIPTEYIEFCGEWHGGQDSMLYAISSTGNLTLNEITGSIECYKSLFDMLECDLFDICNDPQISFDAITKSDLTYIKIAYEFLGWVRGVLEFFPEKD